MILHADVVGSAGLVQRDEDLAHQRFRQAFGRLAKRVETYRGRVLELRGDALVAEFERASDAVAAALAFQCEQTEALDAVEDDLRPAVRVGIALGEVIIADGTVTGAGVVLAQRVEQLAEAGGVCVSSAVHEALPRRMPFVLQSLGDQDLKGFDEAVRVYRVEAEAGVPIPEAQPGARRGRPPIRWKPVILLVVTLMAVIAAVFYSVYRGELPREPLLVSRMAYPFPDRPSIAVMPFASLGDDPEQDWFADGMTEDLITDLSKISGLFVIARDSSFSYRGRTVKVREVAEELGVRYVLEGSVRRAGERVRINAQLVDATTGGHVWAERYDESLNDIFAVQDQVTARIVDAMSVTLTPSEQQSVRRLGSTSVEAHDAYLQGLSFYLRNTPADNASAEEYFLRAVELDPGFSRAHAALAKVYFKGAEREYSRALGIYWRKTVLLAYRHLQRAEDADLADVHVVRSQLALYKHQVEIALREAARALELGANDVDAMKARARALIFAGEYEAGRELAGRIMRQDPVFIAEPLFLIALAHFAEGRYETAADFLERAFVNDSETSLYVRLLAAVYGKLGREREAGIAWERYRKSWHWPVWIAAEVFYYPFEDAAVLEQLAAGLKAAGVAERPPTRYVRLDRGNRLTGDEIRALLFGNTVRGTDFWEATPWTQRRSADGGLRHEGPWFYTGNVVSGEGESWIEGDRLCDRWFDADGDVTICVAVFRDQARGGGHYFVVNDHGPHPFSVVDDGEGG